jgi:hypothetical protein
MMRFRSAVRAVPSRDPSTPQGYSVKAWTVYCAYSRPYMVDFRSVASICVVPYAYSQQLGTATGFIVTVAGCDLLVTNYHVVSGCHPGTEQMLSGVPARPDRLLMPFLWDRTPFCWRPVVQRLLLEDGSKLWVEHPELGSRFDVIAIPVVTPPNTLLLRYDLNEGPNLAIHMSSEVAVIGFPEGMSFAGLTAIWKSGTIASEPSLSAAEEPFFYIDSNTRKGMSGAPVVARRFGGALLEDGTMALGGGISDRILGVYSGRAFEARDMTLGRVWGWAEVKKLLLHAAEQVLRGQVAAVPYIIGVMPDTESNTITIDVHRHIQVNLTDPSGNPVARSVTVGQLLRETALADERFGLSLERVRLAATIDAAISTAGASDGLLSLRLEHYALIKECLEKPTKPYVPVTARLVLPLIEYVLNPDTDTSTHRK